MAGKSTSSTDYRQKFLFLTDAARCGVTQENMPVKWKLEQYRHLKADQQYDEGHRLKIFNL